MRLQSTLSLIFLAFITCICLAQTAFAASTSNDALSQLENHLFFTTYPHDSIDSRLSRLEKRIIGETTTGTPEERIQRLMASQNGPLNPFVSTPRHTTSNMSSDSIIVPKSLQDSLNASSTTATNATSNNANISDDIDCAIDRAKVAVQAEKDEEATHLLSEGVQLWRAKQTNAAIEKFEQVLKIDNNNAQAHFSLGVIAESEGNYIDAVTNYRLALQSKPENKEYKQAMDAAEKKQNAKQNVDVQHLEVAKLAGDANAAYNRGEYLSALDLYKQVDKKLPNQALIKYNIGSIYLMIKDPEEALSYYKEAYKLNHNEARYKEAYEKLASVVKEDEKAVQVAERRYENKYNQSSSEPASINWQNYNRNESRIDALANLGIKGKSHSQGIYIITVNAASRASRVGLQKGDIIKAVDGTVVTSPKELDDVLSHKSPGQQTQLVVQRARMLAQVIL